MTLRNWHHLVPGAFAVRIAMTTSYSNASMRVPLTVKTSKIRFHHRTRIPSNGFCEQSISLIISTALPKQRREELATIRSFKSMTSYNTLYIIRQLPHHWIYSRDTELSHHVKVVPVRGKILSEKCNIQLSSFIIYYI